MLPESHPLYDAEVMLLLLFEHAPPDQFVEFASIWNEQANGGKPPPDGKKVHIEAAQVKDLEKVFDNVLADWILRENRLKRDVYFGVCPRRRIRRTNEGYPLRGRNDDVTHAVCAWMDYDKMTYRAVMAEKPEPTFVVFTGHGAHFYWKYPEAVPIMRAVEDSNKIKLRYGGDDTTDPARLLRIPGTRNWKETEREVKARLENVTEALFDGVVESSSNSGVGPKSVVQMVWEIGNKDFDLRNVIVSGHTAAEGRYRAVNEEGEIDRSAVDWRVMLALLEHGFSEEDIRSVFHNKEFRISEKVLDEAKKGNAENYFDRTYEKARLEHQKRSLLYKEIGDVIEFESWRDIRNSPPLEFAVDHVLPCGGMLIISGPAKSWKSFLTQELIMLLAGAPGKFMGMFDVRRPVADGHVVAYCQAEITKGSLDYRLSRMADSMGANWKTVPVRFLNQRFDLGNPKHLNALIRGLQKIKAQYLILDPLARFHSANENSQKEMSAILANIEAAGKLAGVLGTIVLHHHGKPVDGVDREGLHAIRGSSVIGDWGNAHIILKKKYNKFQGKKYIQVEFELRDAEEPPPISLCLNRDTMRLEPYDEDASNAFIVRDISEKNISDTEKIAEIKLRHRGISEKQAREILAKAKYMNGQNGVDNGVDNDEELS